MATSTLTEPTPASWWSYFFLYDGSKVKEEGDPTRAGICYFYPPQTLLDQQELLCGQIAGVVRCVSDISGSAPTLIRLRKLKFAVEVDGEHLWVLGCAAELPDISCRHFLDQLIGVFHFYNGPVSLAYQSCSREHLHAMWDSFIAQILKNTSDLHKIFNSLWNLDRTKVEPLLLLKAALILQTCQRSPHVLAGCILYKGLIVSTQLLPSLTAKVLIRPAAPQDQRPPAGGGALQERGAALPPNIQLRPVFLTEEEAASLHEFPTEQAVSSAAPLAGPQECSGQRPPRHWSTSAVTENATGCLESAAWTLATTPEPSGPDAAGADGKGEKECLPVRALGHVKPVRQHSPALDRGPGVCHSPAREPRPPYWEEETDLSEIHIPEAQDAGWCPGSFTRPSTCAPDGGSPCPEDGVSGSCRLEPKPPGALPAGTGLGSLPSLSTLETLPGNGDLERHSRPPGHSNPAPTPWEDRLPRRTSRLQSWPRVDSRCSGATLPGGEQGVEQHAGVHHSRSAPASSDSAGSQDDSISADRGGPRPAPISREGLVPMTLYTHSVNGLVLSLLAEEELLGDDTAIQEVHHSSLASLNGLEVHLKETLPKDAAALPSRTYNFTHYDRVQHVLTMNLPQVAAAQDRRFLRAVGLMHSDFARLPALYEMTVSRRKQETPPQLCMPAAALSRKPISSSWRRRRGAPASRVRRTAPSASRAKPSRSC
ncbi:Hermansky-Pudlak syndrome 4 protein isoform X2 [Suricata suricatta]|uniref:Hermansky-Pudlak syndrome 4 protein isoform X2 n=1 Tax=Suricata suricatta TaxID=37032 RepID=UPI0011562AFD|nr:Hermansky-Pudlak syndrome 4 protein isoform X2 [Suricata suricatta]